MQPGETTSPKPDQRPEPRDLAEEIGKMRPFELPEEEAYLNIVRTASAFTDAFGQLFKAHGLSHAQYNVLRIAAAGGDRGRCMEEIGRDMIARDPDVTRLVDRLEKAGLVERERCPDDRRMVYVRITPAGRDLMNALQGPVKDLLREQLGHLGETRLKTLSRLLFEARHPA